MGFPVVDTGQPVQLQTGRFRGFHRVAIHNVVVGLIADEPCVLAGTLDSTPVVFSRSDTVSPTLLPR